MTIPESCGEVVELEDVRWWHKYDPTLSGGDKLQFVVASAGRSGSRWIAEVFSELGLTCGHEFQFTAKFRPRWAPNYIGESSWVSVPFLDMLPCPKFHQVRNPLDVVNSLAGTSYLTATDRSKYGQFQREFANLHPTNYLLASMQFWVQWNRRIEDRALRRWRLEDLDGDALSAACSAAGHPRKAEVCQSAIDAVAPTNPHAHHKSLLTLDDLPQGYTFDALVGLGSRYGYAL